MKNADSKVAAEVARLHDEGMGWKDISLKLSLSPSGKPAPKKAKRLYAEYRGASADSTPAPKAKRARVPKADASTSEGKPARTRKPRKAKTRAGITARQAAQQDITPENSTPVFTYDVPDEEVQVRITGHSVTAVRRVAGVRLPMITEHRVHKVTGFGANGNGGQWVRFIDDQQKTRTLPVQSIIGIQ